MFMLVLGSTALLVAIAVAPRFSTDVLGISTENAVYVFAPAAVGIFLGLRLVDWLNRRVSKSLLVTTGFILVVFFMVTLALVPQAASALESVNPLGIFDPGPFGQRAARVMVTAAFASAAGFAYSMVVVAARALLNERIPVQVQGRVFAAQSVLSNLASIVPLLLAGVLADWVGVAPVLIVVAGVILAVALANAVQTWRTPVPQPA
jgi:MFS family permease